MIFRDSRGICKSRLELLSEGLLDERESTAVSVLAQGRGRKVRPLLWCYSPRLNLKKLNKGNKGLIELFEEIKKGEAWLRLRSDGRVRRFAKRVRVFIRDKSGTWWLFEIARAYYGAKPKYAIKKYEVTGSILNIETSRILVAAQREVQQELERLFPLEAFHFELKSSNGQPGDEHESDAYRELLSINQDYDVTLIVDPWPAEWTAEKPPIISDTRVTVYTKVEKRSGAVKERDSGQIHLSSIERETLVHGLLQELRNSDGN